MWSSQKTITLNQIVQWNSHVEQKKTYDGNAYAMRETTGKMTIRTAHVLAPSHQIHIYIDIYIKFSAMHFWFCKCWKRRSFSGEKRPKIPSFQRHVYSSVQILTCGRTNSMHDGLCKSFQPCSMATYVRNSLVLLTCKLFALRNTF